MPLIAHVAASALRDQTVHDQRANLPLRNIVRRLNVRRIVNEQKVTFAMLLETLRKRQRLVVFRNKSLNRLLNRLFMPIHQTLETNFRQLGLPMNICKHSLHVLQQPFSVRLRVVKRHQKLDLADQVSPTELKECFRLFFVLQIGREEVTADAAEKIVTERFFQNLAAARGIDLEKREELRNETPRPLQLAVLLETRFVDVNMTLSFQKFFQLFIRRLERRRCFCDLFDEKARTDIDADDVTKILLQRSVRNVASAFEISGQCDHVRSEETGFFDLGRQSDIMVTLTVFAPIHELLIFGDEKRLLDEFDLLRDFGRGVGEIEFVSTIGTSRQFEFDDFVDEFRRERLVKILFVSFLCTFFSFDFPFRFWIDRGLIFGRLNNIGGRRLGGIGGIFFELRNFFVSRFQQCFGVFQQCFEFGDTFFEFGNDFFRIHDTRRITKIPPQSKTNSNRP